MPKTKSAPASVRVEVIISIPRAGEFLTTINIPTVGEGSLPEPLTPADLAAKIAELAIAKVKVRPAKGEAARVLKAIKAARS